MEKYRPLNKLERDATRALETCMKYKKYIDPIELAIDGIEYDLLDRRGLKNVWRQIDNDVKEEIKQAWVKILSIALEGITK